MMERKMPMTRRQLKQQFRRMDERAILLQKTLRTDWLGITYAHIATPRASILCRIAYRLSRMRSKVPVVSR